MLVNTIMLIYNQAFSFAFASQCNFTLTISYDSHNYGEVGYVLPTTHL